MRCTLKICRFDIKSNMEAEVEESFQIRGKISQCMALSNSWDIREARPTLGGFLVMRSKKVQEFYRLMKHNTCTQSIDTRTVWYFVDETTYSIRLYTDARQVKCIRGSVPGILPSGGVQREQQHEGVSTNQRSSSLESKTIQADQLPVQR